MKKFADEYDVHAKKIYAYLAKYCSSNKLIPVVEKAESDRSESKLNESKSEFYDRKVEPKGDKRKLFKWILEKIASLRGKQSI